MSNKLYVTRLPLDPSVEGLRACFARYGEVVSVRIIEDRDTGRAKAAAIVTMTRESEARLALTEIHGTTYERLTLHVTIAKEEPAHAPERGKSEPKQPGYEQRARITQQFRELENMTYELDCGGAQLILRIFFPAIREPGGEWRIEGRTSNAPDATVAEATAPSRTKALRDVGRICRENADFRALSNVDWEAVEQAMSAVRAL